MSTGPLDSALEVSPATSGPEWDDYVTAHPDATADHLWGWRDVFSGVFGQAPEYLVARRGSKLVGVLPLVRFRSVLFGHFVVSVPYLNYGGVLSDDADVTAALLNTAAARGKEAGASHVELRHRERKSPSAPYRQHKLALTRGLPSEASEVWDELDRKVRNQVRKAQKAGLSAVNGGRELVGDFYGVFARNMRDLGTPVYSRQLFETVLSVFPREASVTVVRLPDGQPVASAVTIRFNDVVLVPWASSLRDYRHLCPNMLLYWHLIEQAVSANARTFDFGRSSPGSGTHQFKLQWGAVASPMHWEYLMLNGGEPPNQGPSNPKFALAIAAWQRLPLWFANRCGPHLARNLP